MLSRAGEHAGVTVHTRSHRTNCERVGEGSLDYRFVKGAAGRQPPVHSSLRLYAGAPTRPIRVALCATDESQEPGFEVFGASDCRWGVARGLGSLLGGRVRLAGR